MTQQYWMKGGTNGVNPDDGENEQPLPGLVNWGLSGFKDQAGDANGPSQEWDRSALHGALLGNNQTLGATLVDPYGQGQRAKKRLAPGLVDWNLLGKPKQATQQTIGVPGVTMGGQFAGLDLSPEEINVLSRLLSSGSGGE